MGAWRLVPSGGRPSRGRRWALGLAGLALLLLAAWATRGVWTAWLGRSLVCEEAAVASDLILVENFDPSYLVFERAARLQAAGLAPRVLVPVETEGQTETPGGVARGVAEVMAREARLAAWEPLPIRVAEPITLNAAAQLRAHLDGQGVRSVLVVAPAFRSRRSALAYEAMLGPAGMRVRCVPVFGGRTPATWTRSWHGYQEVAQEQVKLQYYRLWVLPVRGRGQGAG